MSVIPQRRKKRKKGKEGKEGREAGRGIPGGPVVGSWCFHCQGPGSVPGPVEELRSHKPGKAASVGGGRRAY